MINVIDAYDDGDSEPNYGASKSIDDSFEGASRWQSVGDAKSLTLDLGSRHRVKELGVAWFDGDQRSARFSVLLSENGTDFDTALLDQTSSGETDSFERYSLPSTIARYIQIEAYGNSLTTENAILEATAFGCTLDTANAVREVSNVTADDFGLDPSVP